MKHFDALIGRAASSMTQRRGEAASASSGQEDALDGLLFMGNPHETVPRALLLDQRLGAVDVLGWQMIRLLSNADRTTAFPTYDELEPLLRSGANRRASRKTVARVIAILRLTRWMTLGMKARNTDNGRMIGNVYVLHDEPLAPAESLSLDAEYIEYVIRCTRHHNRNVAEVAQLVRDELAEGGVLELPSRLDVIDRRAERQRHAEFPAETQSSGAQFPAETEGSLQSFQRKPGQFPEADDPGFHRKLMRKSNTYNTVSRPLDPTTTTVRSTTNNVCNTTARETGAETVSLVWSWPLELTADQRESVTFLVTGLSTEMQQAVIDEAAGRVEAGKVQNTMGFLHTLAKRAASNTFQPTHFGEKIAARRRAGSSKTASASPPGESSRATVRGEAAPLSEESEQMRQALLKKLHIRR